MLSVRFEPPAAKYIKKLKDKKLKTLYREAIDKICNDYTIGEAKTGDLSGFYGFIKILYCRYAQFEILPLELLSFPPISPLFQFHTQVAKWLHLQSRE